MHPIATLLVLSLYLRTENTTSKPGLLPLAPPASFTTPARQQQQQQPFSTAVKRKHKAAPNPAFSQMPAPVTPAQHSQQPPSTPLATPSAQSSAKKGGEASLEVFARLRPPAEKDADIGEGTGPTYEILDDGTKLSLVPPPGAKSFQVPFTSTPGLFFYLADARRIWTGNQSAVIDFSSCHGFWSSHSDAAFPPHTVRNALNERKTVCRPMFSPRSVAFVPVGTPLFDPFACCLS